MKYFEKTGINKNNFSIQDTINILNTYGVIVFRNFFDGDEIFEKYYQDLHTLFLSVIKKHNLQIKESLNLNQIITAISEYKREEVGFVYDLGTRPIKIASGSMLKTHPTLLGLFKQLFKNGVIGFPYLGETLHIFPPGKDNFKYNLPMHQDYPYILQSPEQFTVYANLGENLENTGGIKIWLKSHKDGVSDAKQIKYGYWVTKNIQYYKNTYEELNLTFGKGDLAIFNSLIQHEGIQNHSECTRIVQLIRYSNLNNENSIRNSWRSTGSETSSLNFSDRIK